MAMVSENSNSGRHHSCRAERSVLASSSQKCDPLLVKLKIGSPSPNIRAERTAFQAAIINVGLTYGSDLDTIDNASNTTKRFAYFYNFLQAKWYFSEKPTSFTRT